MSISQKLRELADEADETLAIPVLGKADIKAALEACNSLCERGFHLDLTFRVGICKSDGVSCLWSIWDGSEFYRAESLPVAVEKLRLSRVKQESSVEEVQAALDVLAVPA